jgi:hypothetical protein
MTPDEIRKTINTSLEDGNFKMLRELAAQIAELRIDLKMYFGDPQDKPRVQ